MAINKEIRKKLESSNAVVVRPVSMDDVQDKLVILRGQRVLLDRDVAELYGVETKRVNEAVKNNPRKFPYGYLFGVDEFEKKELVENFDRFKLKVKHTVKRSKPTTNPH